MWKARTSRSSFVGVCDGQPRRDGEVDADSPQEALCSLQPCHVACGKIAERHPGAEREAGLIADAVFGVHGVVTGGVETGDRQATLIDDLSAGVGDEPARSEHAWMQF